LWQLLDLTDENGNAVDDESIEWLTMINHVREGCNVSLQRSLRTVKVDFKELVTGNIMKGDDLLFNW